MTESKYKKRFDNDYKREIVRLVDELGKSPLATESEKCCEQDRSKGFGHLLIVDMFFK